MTKTILSVTALFLLYALFEQRQTIKRMRNSNDRLRRGLELHEMLWREQLKLAKENKGKVEL